MAYSVTNNKGVTFYLHSKDVTLKGGRRVTIYYFSKKVGPGAIDEVPAGYTVVSNRPLPILKKG